MFSSLISRLWTKPLSCTLRGTLQARKELLWSWWASLGRQNPLSWGFFEWKLDWTFMSSSYFTLNSVIIFSEKSKFCLEQIYVNHGYVYIGKVFPVFLQKLENITLSEVCGQPLPSLETPVEGTVSGRTKYVIQCHCLFFVNINLSSGSSLFQLGVLCPCSERYP